MPKDLFISYISKEKRYSLHTITAYTKDLELFTLYIHKVFEIDNIDDVNMEMIRSWVVSMIDDGLTGTSVNRKISTLKSYYNYLIRTTSLNDNPARHIVSIKTPSKLPVYFKEEQLNTLIDNGKITDDFSSLRDMMVIELLYSTGIRRSELINLTIDSIDFSGRSIKVLGKQNKERIIPLSDKLEDSIRKYIEIKEKQFGYEGTHLIVTDKGAKAYPKLIYRIINNGLSGLTGSIKSPHILRHTFATHMLNNGADLNSIKEILGHANLTATQIYTHNTIDKLKKVFIEAHPRAKFNKGGKNESKH